MLASFTGIAGLSAAMTANSDGRIIGANDWINIGFLGTGARSYGHRRMVKGSYEDKSLNVTPK